ncbi:hypothetical protein NQ317_017677 [Molorchus minor]|uniref:C2H2-type domain-containing protein n=1 Tax=Molorchus minor TaxID=1323400 RepID=A0ABQ9JNN1_9CUCU|nr:hypothetical protein NQ317_017677 [Molorchus minor]
MEIKLLSCPLCLKPHFDGVDALRTTLVTVATSHLTCPVCSETLLGLDKLTIHLFSHISSAEIRRNDPQESACEEIDKSIDNISKRRENINERNNNNVETVSNMEEFIRCDICSFSFTDKNILDIHQKLLHQTTPDKKTGTYSYHCHLCSKKFKMRGSLMVHLRVAHYGFMSHGNGNIGSSNDVKKRESVVPMVDPVEDRVKEEKDSGVEVKLAQKSGQVKGQDNKQWECDVCSKMFTTKYFLKKHKRLHTGEMPYCCSLCNKSFTFQQSYHKHMLYHSSEKPYVCNECGRAFKELSTLQNHARIHSGERPFGCETCDADKANSQETALSPTSASQQTTAQNKCIMSVDLNTGNINLIPEYRNGGTLLFSNGGNFEEDQIQKKSILIDNNEQIEIRYNKADLQTAIDRQDGNNQSKPQHTEQTDDNCLQNNEVLPPYHQVASTNLTINKLKIKFLATVFFLDHLHQTYSSSDRDLFSMVLSPILPEVESLCLNNSPNHASPVQNNQEERIDDIGENCLQEFLYGSN